MSINAMLQAIDNELAAQGHDNAYQRGNALADAMQDMLPE